MPDLSTENIDETDSSDNEENHVKLLSTVSQLDSTQRVKPAQRKEVASEISEYNLNKGLTTKENFVKVNDLVQVLSKKSELRVISKKIKKVTEKSKTLPKPLEKPTEERLKRSVGFENVKKQLRRWDAIVARNALKDQIIFPLNNNKVKMVKTDEFVSQFKNETPLEKEIARICKQEYKEHEPEDNNFPLNLDEMIEKRKEMAKLRARLSYQQSKAQRQSKIKSKKYHRLLKREKVRQQVKEFEILQKSDPEAALKKLAELDKTRAKERASLRHRNTGHWAKNLAIRAKYDVETRKILAEELKVSKELTQKVSKLDSSDDEELENVIPPKSVVSSQPTVSTYPANNPWTSDVSKEVQDFVSGYKKFWNEEGKEIQTAESNTADKQPSTESHAKSTNLIQNKEVIMDNDELPRAPQLETQKPLEPETQPQVIPAKILKLSHKKKKSYVTIQPTSGVWLVTSVTDEVDFQKKKKKITDNINKKKANKKNKKEAKDNNKKEAKSIGKKTNNDDDDIDILFDDLNTKLMETATVKIGKIKNKLKRTKEEKKQIKQKENLNKEFDLTLKNANVIERPDMDIELLEGEPEDKILDIGTKNVVANESKSNVEPAIDPNNFIQLKPKRLKSYLPENITGEEEGVDEEKAQQMIIEEAFGEDDVLTEFKEMKEQEEKVEVEATLPGWGEWGGTGIVPNPRKKRLLVPKLPPRKDKLKKDMVINENENPNLKNHLVKEVPHPFKSVEAFEANIRTPLGRDWVPETAHQKLIQKPVVTKLGTIIEPMSEDEIVRLKKASKSPYQGKIKKKSN